MGRTLPTYRRLLEGERSRWRMYRASLRQAHLRRAFDELWEEAFRYAHAASNNPRAILLENVLFSMVLAQKLQINTLQEKISFLEKHIGKEHASNQPRNE